MEELGLDDGALYRGARLTDAIEWNDAQQPRLNKTERAFLQASEARRKLERTQRRRRIALAFSSLTVALLAITAVAVVSIVQGRRTASRELANKSEAILPANPGLAFALALEALRRSDTEQAQSAVRQATLEHWATQVIPTRQGVIFGVAVSPDGRFAATVGGDHTVRIWRVKSGRLVGETRGYREEVRAVSFSGDGALIASAAADGEIIMTDAAGGRREVIARLQDDDYATTIDFSTDGKTLAIGTIDGRVALVRVGDHTRRYLSPDPPIGRVRLLKSGPSRVSGGLAVHESCG